MLDLIFRLVEKYEYQIVVLVGAITFIYYFFIAVIIYRLWGN